MYRTKLRALTFLCLAAALVAGATGCNNSSGNMGSSDTSVAATVNGKKIMMSEVDRRLNAQAQNAQAQNAQAQRSPLELAQARLQILEGLIQQEVVFQRAEKEKLLPSEDEVNTAFASLKQNLTEEEFQRRLQESGQTEQGLREEVRRQLALEKLQNKTAANIGTIRDKEVDEFFDQNKEQFVSRRGVSLAAIVVDPRDNGAQNDAKSEEEATVKANNIYERLRGGSDFATVARAESEDPSNVRGGDLGFIPEEQLRQTGFPSDLIQRFFGMNVGEVTQPVRTPDGRLTIFKLQTKQLENENLTKENPRVRDQIKQMLIQGRQSLLSDVMVRVAMNEAKVVNNLAQSVLNNTNELSGIRPANAPSAGTNNAGATASPNASPAAANPPAATASPAASASPQS